MKNLKSLYISLLVLIVAISLLTQEVEARRKVLKGRKTITRTYGSESALPAWAWIILIAVGELFLGGIIFFLLKRRIVDKVDKYRGTYMVPQTASLVGA